MRLSPLVSGPCTTYRDDFKMVCAHMCQRNSILKLAGFNSRIVDHQQEFQGPLFRMLLSAEYLWDSFYIVVSDLKTDKKHLVTREIIDQVRAEMFAENFTSASEEIKAKFVPRPVP